MEQEKRWIAQAPPESVSTALREFAQSIPPAETIRQKIEEKRREIQFLKRLLKIAAEAEGLEASW